MSGDKSKRTAVYLQRPGTTPNVAAAYDAIHKQLGTRPPNLGQGSEENTLPKELADLWDSEGRNDYNPSFHTKANLAWADFQKRFFGLPATLETSLILQVPGRTLYEYAVIVAAAPHRDKDYKPIMIKPNKIWGVIDGINRDLGIATIEYDIFDPSPANAIRKTIRNCPYPERIFSYYMCSPNNPMGRHFTDANFLDVRRVIIEENNKIVGIHDDPYVPACIQNPEGVYPILNAGYDAVATPLENGNPEIIITSFAKAFQKAQSGEGGVFISDAALMKRFKDVAGRFGGLSYIPEVLDKRAKALGPKYEQPTRKHFAALSEKYRRNWEQLSPKFNVTEGGPNMTALIIISKEILGHQVTYADGSQHTISNGDDFVQFLLNREKPVAVVADGLDPNGDLYIRVANKNTPEIHAEGLDRIVSGIAEAIASAPAGKVPTYPGQAVGAGNGKISASQIPVIPAPQ